MLHIGSGRYRPGERDHTTYGIWKALASGFDSYRVIARSTAEAADWRDGNLRITLLASRTRRELEFLLTQFAAVRRVVGDRPDVIVCQSPVAGGLAALLIAWLTEARLLMEFHGAEFVAPARAPSRLWLLQKLTRRTVAKANRIRVLSERMRDRVIANYGRELADRIRVLSPRVDLRRFARHQLTSLSRGPLRAAIVGTVNENKGQLRLIQALQSISYPIDLHVVGAGSDLGKCRSKAAELADLGSKLQVTCHGAISHAAVAELLQSCDVLVMYSRTEATPRAMVEALACGLPVVTTNVGFCTEIVEDGVEGFVLGPDPDAEIADVLNRLDTNRNLLARMGAAARERARRDYDSVRLFEEYRRLIVETANS